MRNRRLVETDWICSISDFEVANKGGWIVYRQALRDITRVGNPFAVVWPVETQAHSVNPHPSTVVAAAVSSEVPAVASSDVASVPAVASSEVGDAPSM